MVTIPSNVSYGKVVGQFIEAWGDGVVTPGDPDTYPDAKPASGTIVFTAVPQYVVDGTATPNKVTIFPKPVTCTLDANGYLTDPDGNTGVYLIADDDPDLNPTGWTWSALFKVSGTVFTRNFSVTSGGTIDLADILGNSVPSDGGTAIVVVPSAVIDVVGHTGHVTGAMIAADPALTATFVAASTSGPLAYAENISALTTAAPTGGTTVPGCVITIPATAGDVWIEFGADIGISTAGQGNGGVSIAEWTGGTFPAGPLDWSLHHFSSADPVTANGPTVRGSYHLGPTTTDRVFAVGTQTNEEGSALATYTRNGASTNKTYGRTWIAAYTR